MNVSASNYPALHCLSISLARKVSFLEMSSYDVIGLQGRGDLCFRVADEGSQSLISDDDGITALDRQFTDLNDQPISASTFRKKFNDLYWCKTDLHGTVEDHILGGWYPSSYIFRNPSKWISTTGDIRWAIWEIARRLINTKAQDARLTVIRKQMEYSPSYKGARMIGVDPEEVLRARGLDSSHRAVRYSQASSEILWYGRIFPKDIFETTIWNATVSPYPPLQYNTV